MEESKGFDPSDLQRNGGSTVERGPIKSFWGDRDEAISNLSTIDSRINDNNLTQENGASNERTRDAAA